MRDGNAATTGISDGHGVIADQMVDRYPSYLAVTSSVFYNELVT